MGSRHTVIGVTGVIGSGKSTLCRYLKRCGYAWIHADKIVRDLYRTGEKGYRKIKNEFGREFAGVSGVNRKKLRELVLKSPKKLKLLNKAIHPLVLQKVNKKIVQLKSKGIKKMCIEALYFDSKGLGALADKVILVDASDKIILRRLKSRHLPEYQLKNFLKLQRSAFKKRQSAQKIINNSSLAIFYKRIDGMLE